MGLTTEQFYRLTPRQFDALVKRKQRFEQMLLSVAGMICATTANFSMGKDPKKPALQPSDFFRLPEPEAPRMSPEQMLAVLQELSRNQKVN